MSHGSDGLSFSSSRDGDRATLVVAGEVDLSSADALEQRVDQLREAGANEVSIDLADVRFMDSSGLRVLLKIHSELDAAGGRLRLMRPSEAVARLLEVSGLESHFEGVQ